MRQKAFTLIELLIVIAVLGGLLAVIVPALRYSKQKAQSVVCIANMGQLALLLNSYAHLQGFYPQGYCGLPGYNNPPGGYVGNPSYDKMGWRWFHFVADGNVDLPTVEKMISCPSSRTKENVKLTVLCGNLGINYSICKIAASLTNDEFHGKSLSPTMIRQPSQVILLMDAGYTMVNWKAASVFEANTPDSDLDSRKTAFYVPGLSMNPQKTINPYLSEDAIEGRHPNKTLNAIRADGSANKVQAEDLLIASENPQDSPAYSAWSPLSKR